MSQTQPWELAMPRSQEDHWEVSPRDWHLPERDPQLLELVMHSESLQLPGADRPGPESPQLPARQSSRAQLRQLPPKVGVSPKGVT